MGRPLAAVGESSTTTHCPYCALNCGLRLEATDGVIVGTTRWKESPLTGGALCSKGTTAHLQVHHAERITAPLIRRGNDFEEVGWGEALDRAAEGFVDIARRLGPDANAMLSGGSLTNEKIYLVGKLARLGLRTPHVDYNGRFCMTSAGIANKLAFGADRMMTPLAELAAADVVVIVGANLSAAFPVEVPKLLDGVRKRGGRIIVVDPRSSRFVKENDLHLALRPGTDATLFNGLLRQVIDHRLVDDAFVAGRTNGFTELVPSLEAFSLDTVSATVDVDGHDIVDAAQLIGSTNRCIYLHGRGPEQQIGGVDNVLALINLGLACGHVGGPGRGINMLTGQRNGQGGREWGQRCNQLPAGRNIDDLGDRATVAHHWGTEADALPGEGKTYVEILQMAGRREIRGLLAICTNMSVSSPDLTRVNAQMSALDHCVIIDPFFSESARHADVVLPGSTFAEEEGTVTTIEGRVVKIDQAVDPVAGLGDLEILRGLAERLGCGDRFAFSNASDVFEEMRRVSAGGPVDYSGMTYDRIRRNGGLFWPCPTIHHPGTPQLYRERFHHADGRARFHVVVPASPPADTDEEHPLVLTTGRVLAQYLSGNQTMRIERQNSKAPRPVLEVHPKTASRYGLMADEPARLTSRQGQVEVAWKPNPGLRLDTLFLPYHWVEANTLVADHLDPVSKIPGFKFTPVSVAPVSGFGAMPPQRGVVETEARPGVDLWAAGATERNPVAMGCDRGSTSAEIDSLVAARAAAGDWVVRVHR